MIGHCAASAVRLLTGAKSRWIGCEPVDKQRVFFANHTSNLDFVMLWAALPAIVRAKTRPVAAHDYWTKGPVRLLLAGKVFRAVLIERKRVTRSNNPLEPMLSALEEGCSLIIFPEGGRTDGRPGEFKSGIYHLARARSGLEFVPVFIENLNRVLPKGEVLPIPILCSVRFGAPLSLQEGEEKSAFLERVRLGMLQLAPIA
ncbi:MAG: 1-acyl-sn-glycerol-3-phosphate acyltransferase [Verrucomicrobiota bacterium]|nr:1-acyl-sn-glycerol-3-phosphate acyltransferase [Verrucomicrobiota bacterium]